MGVTPKFNKERYKALKHLPESKGRILQPENQNEELENDREIQRRVTAMKNAYGIKHDQHNLETKEVTVRCASCNCSTDITVRLTDLDTEAKTIRQEVHDLGWREVELWAPLGVHQIKVCKKCISVVQEESQTTQDLHKAKRRRKRQEEILAKRKLHGLATEQMKDLAKKRSLAHEGTQEKD